MFDKKEFIISIIIICIIIWGEFLLISNSNMIIYETYITETIPLYDSSVIRDDLCTITLNISSKSDSEENYHALMQFKENDQNKFVIPKELYKPKTKLADETKLIITGEEVIRCNLLYYHGFTNFTPKTYIKDETIQYTLYINPDNIVYE